jgi:hypothetical protein
MAAACFWASEVLGDFIHINVAVNDFKKKLNGALQPDVQASYARSLDDDGVVQIAEGGIFEPRHQKSSADGIRL